ncbi:hypothetical protein [Lachnoclostridium phytofermentans]|uniref:Uncharacterized protein n=1 Tax=Lachnoclostridium phytofermentans (strain ATCC 700394 / DSM 18823 / ISDg) TaxID=357809 RepID=A9KPC0_LACP7|nr:hypothetical protein [Lachnoclostridium phytofermentans]ABX41782.1 hypothetical protein Cphy_1407 [Lachnoclostridium phytofermentans ISDg]
MWFIIKKELTWFLKNPIYYIGAILVFLVVYVQCQPYLTINYFQQGQMIETLPIEQTGDTDIMDGYIPVTEKEGFDISLDNLRQDLINSIGIDEKQVNELINYIEEKNMNKEETIEFIESKCSYIGNVRDYFYSADEMKLGTVEELNSYIGNALDKEDYAAYFGR